MMRLAARLGTRDAEFASDGRDPFARDYGLGNSEPVASRRHARGIWSRAPRAAKSSAPQSEKRRSSNSARRHRDVRGIADLLGVANILEGAY